MSVNLFDKLNSNLDILHKQLGRDDVSLARISGADLFYTDGSASGASFKINPLGIYYKEDGTEHFCWSANISDATKGIINAWITSVKTSLTEF